MNNFGNLNYRNLELGDLVSWEHPVTGRIYNFEVTDLDWNDDWQPVELQLLDDIDCGSIVNVSEYSEFSSKGYRRWPYISNISHKERYGWGIPENSITLDRLFYTSGYNGPKVDFHEPELIEDFGVSKGDASREESVLIPEKVEEPVAHIADLKVPSITGLQEIIYTSKSDFGVMVTKALAKAIKQGKTYAELPPVLIEMHKEELEELGYEVRFSAIYWDFLD